MYTYKVYSGRSSSDGSILLTRPLQKSFDSGHLLSQKRKLHEEHDSDLDRKLAVQNQSGRFRADNGTPEPLRWLRVAIPVAVLLVVLFWVFLVFMNENYWEVRANADLPVIHWNSSQLRTPREIIIAVNQTGQILISQTPLTADELLLVLGKTKEHESGILPPVVIRASANTLWGAVEPVLSVVRKIGSKRISFAVMFEDEFVTTLLVRISEPLEPDPVIITRAADTYTLNKTPATWAKTQKVIARLSRRSHEIPIVVVTSPSNTVQEVIDMLDLCSQHRLVNTYLLDRAPEVVEPQTPPTHETE